VPKKKYQRDNGRVFRLLYGAYFKSVNIFLDVSEDWELLFYLLYRGDK